MAELCDDTQCIAAVGQRRNTGDHLAGVVLGETAGHFGRCAVASNEENAYHSLVACYFDVIARNHNIFACRNRSVEQAGQGIGNKPDTGHVGFCAHVDHFYVFQGIAKFLRRNDVECQFVDSRVELGIRVLESTQDTVHDDFFIESTRLLCPAGTLISMYYSAPGGILSCFDSLGPASSITSSKTPK